MLGGLHAPAFLERGEDRTLGVLVADLLELQLAQLRADPLAPARVVVRLAAPLESADVRREGLLVELLERAGALDRALLVLDVEVPSQRLGLLPRELAGPSAGPTVDWLGRGRFGLPGRPS